MGREVVRSQPPRIFPSSYPVSEADRGTTSQHACRACRCWQSSSYQRARVLYLFVLIMFLGPIVRFLLPGGASSLGTHVISVLKRQDSSSASTSEGGPSSTGTGIAVIFTIVGFLLFALVAFILTSCCCREGISKGYPQCCCCGFCCCGPSSWGLGAFDEDEESMMDEELNGRLGDGRSQAKNTLSSVLFFRCVSLALGHIHVSLIGEPANL